MAAHQAPPSLGFSRQEHWSGLPFPSPMHESEKWKWSPQACPTLHDPMDCSPPGSSVHGIFQARVLEWGAIAFSAQYTLVSNNSLRWLIYHLRTSGKREGNRKRNYLISFFFHFSQLSVIRRHVQHTNNNNQPLLVRQRKSLGREREENMKKEREEGSKDCPQETWQLRKCSYYGARTEKSFL